MIKERYVKLVDTFEINTSNVNSIDNILLDKIVEESKKSANKYGIGNTLQIAKDQAKLDQGLFASAENCVSYIHTQHKNKYYKYVVVPRKQGIYTIVSLYEAGLSQNQIAMNMASPEYRTYVAEDAFGNLEKRVHAPSIFQKGPNKKKVADEQAYYDIITKVIYEGIYIVKMDIESGNLNVNAQIDNNVVTNTVKAHPTTNNVIDNSNKVVNTKENKIDNENKVDYKPFVKKQGIISKTESENWEDISDDIKQAILEGYYVTKMMCEFEGFDFDYVLEQKEFYNNYFKNILNLKTAIFSSQTNFLAEFSNKGKEIFKKENLPELLGLVLAFCEIMLKNDDFSLVYYNFNDMRKANDLEKLRKAHYSYNTNDKFKATIHNYFYNFFNYNLECKRLFGLYQKFIINNNNKETAENTQTDDIVEFKRKPKREIFEAIELIRANHLNCSLEELNQKRDWAATRIVKNSKTDYKNDLVVILETMYLPKITNNEWQIDKTALALVMAYDEILSEEDYNETVFPTNKLCYCARMCDSLQEYIDNTKKELEIVEQLDLNEIKKNVIRNVIVIYHYLFMYQMGLDLLEEKNDSDINTRIESYKENLVQMQEELHSENSETEKINNTEQTNNNLSNDNTLKYYVNEDGEKFILEIELPGIEKEEINIDYVDDYITVSINSKDTEVKSNITKNIYGNSMKHYVGEVIENKIDASLKNGILNLVIPKKEVKEKTKIEIK